MFLIFQFLPALLFAYTISTDMKIGDEICTSVDVMQHKILSDRLKSEMKVSELAPEDTLEGKTLIKSYLSLNQLRFSAQEREEIFQMHLKRLGATVEQFEQYLKANGLTKEAFVEELVYRQEVLRWMVQTYSWKEVVTSSEKEALKRQLMAESDQSHAGTVTFEVVKLKDRAGFPAAPDKDFWTKHSKDSILYKDISIRAAPEPYEGFLASHGAGAISEPIEAYGAWHLIHIISKPEVVVPPDAMLQNYLMEQKCMKHLSAWTKEQLAWVYKNK